jgi:hypothetical protein
MFASSSRRAGSTGKRSDVGKVLLLNFWNLCISVKKVAVARVCARSVPAVFEVWKTDRRTQKDKMRLYRADWGNLFRERQNENSRNHAY